MSPSFFFFFNRELIMADDPSNVQMPSTASASAPTPVPVGEYHTSANPLCEPVDITSSSPEGQGPRQRKYTSYVWVILKGKMV